jgi:predicted transposase YbfD/YdcC
MDEVNYVMEKIKEFEDAIPTIWLPEQLEEITAQVKEIEDAMA